MWGNVNNVDVNQGAAVYGFFKIGSCIFRLIENVNFFKIKGNFLLIYIFRGEIDSVSSQWFQTFYWPDPTKGSVKLRYPPHFITSIFCNIYLLNRGKVNPIHLRKI